MKPKKKSMVKGCNKQKKMNKIIVATFKMRGTEKEIDRIKARIASLTACEEIVSMYIREIKT